MISEILNSECFCVSLDQQALKAALTKELQTPEMAALVEERCPYLFSAYPVFELASNVVYGLSEVQGHQAASFCCSS